MKRGIIVTVLISLVVLVVAFLVGVSLSGAFTGFATKSRTLLNITSIPYGLSYNADVLKCINTDCTGTTNVKGKTYTPFTVAVSSSYKYKVRYYKNNVLENSIFIMPINRKTTLVSYAYNSISLPYCYYLGKDDGNQKPAGITYSDLFDGRGGYDSIGIVTQEGIFSNFCGLNNKTYTLQRCFGSYPNVTNGTSYPNVTNGTTTGYFGGSGSTNSTTIVMNCFNGCNSDKCCTPTSPIILTCESNTRVASWETDYCGTKIVRQDCSSTINNKCVTLNSTEALCILCGAKICEFPDGKKIWTYQSSCKVGSIQVGTVEC